MAKIFTDPKYADTHAIRPHGSLVFDDRQMQLLHPASNLYEVKQAARSRKLRLVDGPETGLKELLPNGDVESYYLPYRQNATTRITLDPAGKQVDPKFFVTDELNGCMVVVYGPPESPTVYHLNAEQFGGNLANVPAADVHGVMIRKNAEMTRRVQAARAQFPVVPACEPTGRMIKSVEYLEYECKPAVRTTLIRKMQTALRINPADYPNFPADDFNPAEPIIQAFGFVFGIKDSRTGWSFYLQSRLRVQPNVPMDGTQGQNAGEWNTGDPSHHVLWTKKFYPTGMGSTI